MSTVSILSSHSSFSTQNFSRNNIPKVHRTRKPLRYIELYIPTMSSSQGLASEYYLSTFRGQFYTDTNGIFYDERIQYF